MHLFSVLGIYRLIQSWLLSTLQLIDNGLGDLYLGLFNLNGLFVL